MSEEATAPPKIKPATGACGFPSPALSRIAKHPQALSARCQTYRKNVANINIRACGMRMMNWRRADLDSIPGNRHTVWAPAGRHA